CDGVRCDMAMLLLPEIFQRTWGITAEPFWPKATAAVQAKYPAFTHGGGLLGSRMDIAATGLRLLLRQAAQRSAEGGRGKTNPRPPAGRHRLSGQARALSRKPRRTARGS